MAKLELQQKSVLEDPSSQAIAKIYAEALLSAVPDDQVEGVLEEYASFMDDVLGQSPEFASLIYSGRLNEGEKIDLIDRVVTPRSSQYFSSFLKTLARRHRLELLALVLAQCIKQYHFRMGKRPVTVVSATEMNQEVQDKVRNRLKECLSFEPVLTYKVDTKLLGGLVIRVGDYVYDTSLRTRLKQLRNRLSERGINEIQSGRNRFSSPEGD